MHANKENPVDELHAGHIYAVIGLKETTTGDTLCAVDAPVVLESMSFPEPVIFVAIEPKTKGDQEKLSTAIQKLSAEDPTFTVSQNEETGQTEIGGMGELHLDILVDRMFREFRVEANVGKPQVAYRETIRRKVEKFEFTHKKQTGGSGQFARVILNFEPIEAEAGEMYEFENKVTGGRIPREFIPSVDEGIQEAMQNGVLAGYPLVVSRRRSPMAPTTMLTRQRWRSRSPVRWPCVRASSRPVRCCLSRSWKSKYVPQRNTWATSSAT